MHKKLTVAALLLYGAILAAIILTLGPIPKSSSDVTSLFPYTSKALLDYQRQQQLFGQTSFEAVVISTPPVLSEASRGELLEFADRLAALSGVSNVFSPVEGYSEVNFPLRVLTPDRQNGRFVIEVFSDLTAAERSQLESDLEEVITDYPHLKPLRAGGLFVSSAITRTLFNESQKWTPLCLTAIFLLLTISFRSVVLTFFVMIPPLLSLLTTVAALLIFDITTGPLTQLAPPLLLAIGASYSTFVATRVCHSAARQEHGMLRGLNTSLSLAVATTVAGFISLIVMNCRAVSEFALVMSCGTVISGALSLFLTPILIYLRKTQSHYLDPLAERLSDLLAKIGRSRIVTAICALFLLLGLGISRIKVDTDPVKFLPEGSAARQEFERAREIFPGNYSLSIILSKEQGLSIADLSAAHSMVNELAALPGVAYSLSSLDLMEFNNALISKGLDREGLDELGPAQITTKDRQATRIILNTDLDGAALLNLSSQVEKITSEWANRHRDIGVGIASRELVLASQATELAHGIIWSVTSTLFLVAVLLGVLLKSIRLALIGILPSALPILGVFGIIGLVMGQINLSAAVVAAVALGMVSDNTFHYLLAWLNSRGKPDCEANLNALRICSTPFLFTAIVLIGGFSVTDLSDVQPVREFGLLLGASLSLGFVGNAIILPQLVSYLNSSKLGN